MEFKDEEEVKKIVSELLAFLEEQASSDPYIYFKGRGRPPLSPKFNVVIYRNNKGKFKVVTTDEHTLLRLLSGEKAPPKQFRIDVDDAGVGSPIGGVLIGAYGYPREEFLYGEIKVNFFQPPLFAEKKYLDEAASITWELLRELKADPATTIVYICPGHIHAKTRQLLRQSGFEVQLAEIGQPLQDLLEDAYKEYLKNAFGFDGAFDPKREDPRQGFRRAINWLREDSQRLTFAKTGWPYFKDFRK